VRAFVALPVVVAMAAVAGCPKLSEADLELLNARPTTREVALTPPGLDVDDEEALDASDLAACAARDLRCMQGQAARSMNAAAFVGLRLLDELDDRGPTLRAAERSVWGPTFIARDERTVRVELARGDDGTLTFCAHAARGDVHDEPFLLTTCADVSIAGARGAVLERMVRGTFLPGALDAMSAMRAGTGTLEVDADGLARLARRDDVGGRLAIAWERIVGDDGVRFDSHIDVVGLPIPGSLRVRDARLDFASAPDGGGAFRSVAFASLVAPAVAGDDDALEELALASSWSGTLAGRADADVAGGDIDAGGVRAVAQCWDAALESVFERGIDVVTGDETRCATPALAP
jgi:hypothetical protein